MCPCENMAYSTCMEHLFGTLHCVLENGVDLYVNERQKYDTIALGLLKKEE